ncbi:hypothetical protein C0J52_01348 [Blattella germanica]|nr:hypothetical protein C0J52_01348 [Blattella germanica]
MILDLGLHVPTVRKRVKDITSCGVLRRQNRWWQTAKIVCSSATSFCTNVLLSLPYYFIFLQSTGLTLELDANAGIIFLTNFGK